MLQQTCSRSRVFRNYLEEIQSLEGKRIGPNTVTNLWKIKETRGLDPIRNLEVP
jgi:hypothetical protein